MPTREAYAVAVLALLIFFVAFNLQSGWVFAVDALLVGFLAAGFLSARHGVWRISLGRTLPGEVVEGELVGVGVELTATGFGRHFFVEVIDRIPGIESTSITVPVVYTRGAARVSYRARALRRGHHHVHTAVIRSTGLTGLFAAQRIVPAPGAITVYPRYWKLSQFALAALTPAVQTVGSAKRRGDQEFYALRDYRPGDSMRHVHWRSSARRGSLMVREFEQEVPGAIALLVDTRSEVQAGGELENTFEDLVRAAASIAWYVISRGGTVRLLAAAGCGLLDVTGGWKPVLRALAALQPDGQGDPVAVVSRAALGSSLSVVVLTPDPGALDQVARTGAHVVGVVADPSSYVHPTDEQRAPVAGAGPDVPVCLIHRGDDIGARLEQCGR